VSELLIEDPDNDEYKEMASGLKEVIELTEDLLSAAEQQTQEEPPPGGDAEAVAVAAPFIPMAFVPATSAATTDPAAVAAAAAAAAAAGGTAAVSSRIAVGASVQAAWGVTAGTAAGGIRSSECLVFPRELLLGEFCTMRDLERDAVVRELVAQEVQPALLKVAAEQGVTTASESAVESTSRVRASLPNLFVPGKGQPVLWRRLFLVDEYLRLSHVAGEEWAPFAGMLLRGSAIALWQSVRSVIQTWQQFKEALLVAFEPINAMAKALDHRENRIIILRILQHRINDQDSQDDPQILKMIMRFRHRIDWFKCHNTSFFELLPSLGRVALIATIAMPRNSVPANGAHFSPAM
ncbi:unnamed protein product, partial [Closterium sp. NIES-54]